MNFIYWHAEGWDWVKKNAVRSPLYWHPVHTHAITRIPKASAPILPGRTHIGPGHNAYYTLAVYGRWRWTSRSVISAIMRL